MVRLRSVIISVAAALLLPGAASADDLVILHTNDTHSSILPDEKGAGGWLQRKAVIDSVRKAEKNVILVDAGDVVQGTLFFKNFKGEVEYPLLEMMDYDIRVLGNHEFDNGMSELARYYKKVDAARLSANYDFTGTELEGVFEPYVIKKVAGKKIGFIGLNVNPESLIATENISVNFLPIVETADKTAAYLKRKKKCDLVVAVTHIGYEDPVSGRETDVDIAHNTRDIDIIVGGHSHTLIDPESDSSPAFLVDNADGRPVLITQTGKYGKYLGYIKIDLDRLDGASGKDFDYRLIPVTDRFDSSQLSREMADFLRPYKEKVDSINSRVIGRSLYDLPNAQGTGGLQNFTADFAFRYGRFKADSLVAAGADIRRPDLALMNAGGMRQPMPAGDITEGEILAMYPFSNHIMLIAIKGKHMAEALDVASKRGGEPVSENVRVLRYPDGSMKAVVDGKPIDPDREYVLATIDYLAGGNDDMRSLANHRVLWRDDTELCAPILRYIKEMTETGLPVAPDRTPRFQDAVVIGQ